MCTKHLFHPTGPCCGDEGLCNRWPRINWNAVAFKVTMSSALTAHERWKGDAFDDGRAQSGSPIINPTDADYEYEGLIADYDGIGPPSAPVEILTNSFDPFRPRWGVYGSTWASFIHAGVYRSNYVGPCRWLVPCRERLCPGSFAIVRMDKATHNPATWWPAAHVVVEDALPVDSGFDYANFSEGFQRYTTANPGYFKSWRQILQHAECVWLPKYRAQGWTPVSYEAIDGGLMLKLEAAEEAIRNPTNEPTGFYTPNAIELAIAQSIVGGITFQVVSDKRSPFYGQFIVSSGCTRDYTIPDQPFIAVNPWNLVSHESFDAQFDQVYRFERTDDNTTLPAWLELQLVPI